MRKRKWLFRYEAKWSLVEKGGSIIQDGWERNVAEQDSFKLVENKLNSCRRTLIRWSSQREKEAKKEIEIIKNKLKGEQENEVPHIVAIIKTLEGKLSLLLKQEDLRWNQREKHNWYKMGDKITKFFHSVF